MIKSIVRLLVAVVLLSLPASLFAQNKRQVEFMDAIPKLNMDGFVVNHESPGMTTSPGYEYPAENVGKKLYPETEASYTFSPIAKTKDGAWILVLSPKYDSPVWISRNHTYSLEENYDVPVFQTISKKDITIPEKSIDPSKGISGTIKTAFGEEEAYSMPRSFSDTVVCKIPNGEKIVGVAMLDQGLDVLVKSGTCNGYVWIWKIDVEWKNNEDWTRLNLPILKPQVSKKSELPEIKYVSRVKAEAPLKKKGTSYTLFVQDTNGKEHEWNKKMPDHARAKNIETADLVVTIRKIPNRIETCTYLPYGAFSRIRLDLAVFLTLSDPAKLIAKTIIKGGTPPSCPSSMNQNDPSKGIGKPESGEFLKWLGPYLAKP
ncbi:MAG: hypothetical protein WC836_10685 [Desulfobacula sp.]|jgi:hypothetical protein